ncbi:divergent polysaccharide deacetylase family protein [Rhizosaccharibacter radicis]|uniref:Divergent polysaccharide deacetylase family protein n=1 Tax=Rhizosaccharibacter radicis TaxID=2782605 RepID=A0ABT1VXE4_9PROT|nr:divergent polysaccharide deacetylase family protein [Acetobacteraceae bacterium KSS12]
MPGPIAPPDPALLEPAPSLPGRMLPRIGADGRQPRLIYAATPPAVPPGDHRIAILVEGIGLSAALTREAIETLPPAISLAVSPHAAELKRAGAATPLLDEARKLGHELLLSLPMQPASRNDDEGPHALDSNAPEVVNRADLFWVLSRLQGYAGVTGAFGGMAGERFSSSSMFTAVAEELRDRGLFYVPPRPDAPPADGEPVRPLPGGLFRAPVSVVLDEQPDAADITARLSRLEQIAASGDGAIGLAGPLRPVVVERLRSWSAHLAERGFVLVPVSSFQAAGPATPSRPAVAPDVVPDIAPATRDAPSTPSPAGAHP